MSWNSSRFVYDLLEDLLEISSKNHEAKPLDDFGFVPFFNIFWSITFFIERIINENENYPTKFMIKGQKYNARGSKRCIIMSMYLVFTEKRPVK